jgi:subtilisin family serine protease
VFAVGAIDGRGALAYFSSTGPVTVDGSGRIKPDIVAPGMDILSSYPGNTYHRADGTSMAGPHVAGVVALMWSANPALIGDIDRTERILTESARMYDGKADYTIFDALGAPLGLCTCSGAGETGKVPNNAVGYGVVDAYAAVKMALESAVK